MASSVMPNAAEQKLRRKRSSVSKYEGDDLYSWALFVDGRAVYTGMSRSEAKWRRDIFVENGKL